MKKILGVLMAVCFVSFYMVYAEDVKINSSNIDDFEDGSYLDNPEWWVFDNIALKCEKNNSKDAYGEYSLVVGGKPDNWYVGGMGTNISVDGTRYTNFDLDVYGNGPKSGKLKIELYEDDNGNWEIEQDADQGYLVLNDDKVVYQVLVNWTGWKHLSIPFVDFIDANRKVGDDVWNPGQDKGSGGLIQFNFLAVSTGKTTLINFKLDNIKLTKQEMKKS